LGNRRAALSRLDLTGEKAGWELMWEGKNPPTDTRGFFEAVKFPLPQPSRVVQIKLRGGRGD